jgi:hypothetical protein
VTPTYPPPVELGFLSSLGIGPGSPLMNEPRLLIDPRFLGAVMVELEDELGSEEAQAIFYQIGFFHGLRDGLQLVERHLQLLSSPHPEQSGPIATPLAVSLGARRTDSETGSIEISGEWPECYEARTRLARLGPEADPHCWLSAGYTAGSLSASFDADMVVLESECRARGDGACRFVALEAEAYRSAGPACHAVVCDSASFDAFRNAVGQCEAAAAADEGPMDLGEPAVHIWGPVMVLPFTNVEQALRTVEMLGRDADTTDVRAVVLDLRSAPLDEGYGAIALEQVLESIDIWGAEVILTGVSDLSASVVADLEDQRLLLRKDISEAIATAFQIAEVQRHLL